MLLALDTSTTSASVALFDGRRVLAEKSWQAERRQTADLFPAIEGLLGLSRIDLNAVDRIAVATGPGSFTGLRAGIAAAQGLARGRGAALVGVPTLDVLAYAHAACGGPACALLPAGRTEWYAAFYDSRDGTWARRNDISLRTLEMLCDEVTTDTLFTGEIDAVAETTLRDVLGSKATFAPPASRLRRAGFLAELGWRQLEAGGATAPAHVEPLYVRAPAIRIS